MYLPSPIHSKYINKEALLRYLPVGGVRIEDDILITSSGYENLTTAPKGEEMLRIIKSQDNDASQAIAATETDEAPVVVPTKIKDLEWLNIFDTPTQSASRTSHPARSGQPRFDFGFIEKTPNPCSQSTITESLQYKLPIPPNCQNVTPDILAKRRILESRKIPQQEGKTIETSNRLSKSSEPQPEVSLVSRPKPSRFRSCTPCKKRMVCSSSDGSPPYRTNSGSFRIAVPG